MRERHFRSFSSETCAIVLVALLFCGCAGKAAPSAEANIPQIATPPPIVLAAPKPINACCQDPTCDRVAFARNGGVCAGDPRAQRALPIKAMHELGPRIVTPPKTRR